jgi:hypothetical protein
VEDVWVTDPPDDPYDRVTNPERFGVLHTTAYALVSDLQRRFDPDELVADLRAAVESATERWPAF